LWKLPADLGDNPAMTKRVVLAFLCAVAMPGSSACDSASERKAPAPVSPGPGTAKCNLNTQNPGPLIRGGLASVRIDGPHMSVDRKKVPALCGPIYNVDQPKLDANAGDGLLLETCLPEGTVQVTSYKRVAGKQALHSSSEQAGTEVLFNKNEGSTYTSRGASSDSIVLSPDFWHAEMEVELVDVMGSDKLHAKITFDCPNPSPLELKAAEEKAQAPKAASAPDAGTTAKLPPPPERPAKRAPAPPK
jgi:hypothetical protein